MNVMVSEPVLLIEILSPNNELRTRANIWAYTTTPSVQEILAIHSTRIEAELLRRQTDNNWPEKVDIIIGTEPLTLTSTGFTVPLDALYRTTALTRLNRYPALGQGVKTPSEIRSDGSWRAINTFM